MAKKIQRAPTLLRRLHQEGGWIARFAWSPDGREIGAGSQGGFVNVWEASTGRPTLTSRLKADHIFNFIWHPDSKHFFTSDDKGRISVWDARESALIKHINVPDKIRIRTRDGKDYDRRHVHGLALLSDARWIVAGGPFGLLLWEIETGKLLHHSAEHLNIITLAVSPDGRRLASTSYGDNVCVWNAADFRVERRFPATYSCALSWSPDSRIVAATRKNSIVLWDAESGRAMHVLEGHTVNPRAVAFSSDGKLFASRAGEHGAMKNERIDNKVMIWSTPAWDLHAVIEETAGWYLFTGLAFEPGTHRLATTAEQDRAIHIWDAGGPQLVKRRYFPVFYKNAKVALVGDSGVGKSGLALVLTGRKFAATHSTHARRVLVLRVEKVKVGAKRNEVRETVLWDLAGQPGYRLIHQLHLDDVALALIVFDSKDERDPFAGARHWNRALLNARLGGPQVGALPKRMLVAARIDRGPVSVSKARIDEFCGELGVDCGYAETSAKENLGVGALLSAIAKNVPWKLLPTVTSNALFQKIKSYLTGESKSGRVLATADELYRGFLKKSRSRNRRGLRAEFSACVEGLESLGLLREFSFGDLILLQPELLDVYASSIIFAAKQEPDGMGTIPEQRVLSGDFPVPLDERIRDRRQESLLLHATVEDLVKHEVALREASDDGQFLVFPSQLTRENPDLPDPVGKSVVIDFAGPVINIYATLVVRLSHSGFYRLKTLWRNAATFESSVSGVFGVFLSDLGEGVGRMTIFYDSVADYPAKQQFEDYITTHLVRRALPSTVKKRRVVICPSPGCNTPVSEVSVDRRKERGFDWIACNVCDTRIPLISATTPAEVSAEFADIIGDIDTSAKDRRQMDEAVLAASGEMLTPVFKRWVGAEAGTIALVFTDVVGSTAMAVELGDESMEQIRRKHFDNAYAAAARNDGYVIKTIGDAFMVAFRTAVKAFNFALDLKASTGHERVKIRAGIHVGPVRIAEEDVFGSMVNYTSRVVSYVHDDQIWLSDHAYEDIQLEKAKAHGTLTYLEHSECELKGFKGPQRLWEVRSPK
jgi:class 3 adenylate cyclase/WD40 repeat protein/GTPase SAR1 family protein